MMEIEVCHVPYEPHGWLPPPPTAASWRALLALGVTGVRLQYNYDEPLWFRSAYLNALTGGMRVTGNFVANLTAGTTPSQIESGAFTFANMYADHLHRVSFGNEPGYVIGENGMAEYVQNFVAPFVRGVRRANPNAIIGGCDAESADTQQRFIFAANNNSPMANLCDFEMIHPYGDVGNLAYATSKVFADSREVSTVKRPWGISEIGHQEMDSAKQRAKDVTEASLAAGKSKDQAALDGALARLKPTDNEIMALMVWFHNTARDYPDCALYTFQFPEYWFAGTTRNGMTYNSFYTDAPVVSPAGRELATTIALAKALADGPVKVADGHRAAGRRG